MAKRKFLHRWLDYNWLYNVNRCFVTQLPTVWIKRNHYLRKKERTWQFSSSFLSVSLLFLSVSSFFHPPIAVAFSTWSSFCNEAKCRSKPDSLTCRNDDCWLIRDWSLRVMHRSTIRKLPIHRVITATTKTKWPCSLLSILLLHIAFPSHFVIDHIFHTPFPLFYCILFTILFNLKTRYDNICELLSKVLDQEAFNI